MVETGSSPTRCGVAHRAIGGETAGNVRRIRGPLEVCLVAGVAGGGSVVVVVVGVALRAGHGGVLARQRIMRVEGVIELGIGPIDRGVAGRAVARQPELHVRRIIAVLVVGRVARVALRRRSLVHIIDVARDAWQRSVRSRKCVARIFQVVKLGVEPTVHRVAGLAGGWEIKPPVIHHRREKVLLMARVAARGQARELPGGRLLVALVACHQGMRSHQREPVLVVLNRLQRNLPALYGVAIRTTGAELAAMDIRVAVGALRAYVLEYQAGMTLIASHIRVHSTQRISGQIVIEVRIRSDWFPTGVGVTVGAGSGERAMGIGHLGPGRHTGTDAGAPAGTAARRRAAARGGTVARR